MQPAVNDIRALYRARAGRVDFLDVPELTYLVLPGTGAPESPAFAAAAETLAGLSATVRFIAHRRTGVAGRPMPLEALWWSEGGSARVDLVAALALGVTDVRAFDRSSWRWQAMIVQPPGIDEAAFEQAFACARKNGLTRIDEVRLEAWCEGTVAQLAHAGSYSSAARAVAGLHDAIEGAGYRPSGRHHEIYLTDPRRTERDAMRMVLRRPVAAG